MLTTPKAPLKAIPCQQQPRQVHANPPRKIQMSRSSTSTSILMYPTKNSNPMKLHQTLVKAISRAKARAKDQTEARTQTRARTRERERGGRVSRLRNHQDQEQRGRGKRKHVGREMRKVRGGAGGKRIYRIHGPAFWDLISGKDTHSFDYDPVDEPRLMSLVGCSAIMPLMAWVLSMPNTLP